MKIDAHQHVFWHGRDDAGAWRMHNVRVCGEWKQRILVDDPRCQQLFRKAGELGCPVVIHLDVPYFPDAGTGAPVYQPNWYEGTIVNLERAAAACPDTITLLPQAKHLDMAGPKRMREEEY